jgi:hypothetical protein
MKTSNKLLLAAFALILAGTILILIKIKSFVSETISIINNEKVELSGVTEEKDYNIASFTRLKVEGAISLELSKGSSNSLTVKADTAIIKHVNIDQGDGKLSIKLVNVQNKRARAQVKLIVSDLNIEHIAANAGAKLNVIDTLSSENIDIEVNAGGHGNFPVSCIEVECSANAGGFATLKGNAEKFRGSATAGGHVKARELYVKKAKAKAIAGGHVIISVSEELDADCTAGGVVKYNGNPTNKNVNTSAGGRVVKD